MSTPADRRYFRRSSGLWVPAAPAILRLPRKTVRPRALLVPAFSPHRPAAGGADPALVGTPASIGEGTTPVTTPAGASHMFVIISAFGNSFATGYGIPNTLTHAGGGFTQRYTVSGGTGIPDSFTCYVKRAPAAGTNDLVLDLPGGPSYDGGPTCLYGFVSNTLQGSGDLDGCSAVVQGNTLGTSTSLAAPAGAAATDLGLVIVRDFSDTTATLNSNNSPATLTVTVNSETLHLCFTNDPTATAGATGGGSNQSGFRFNFKKA